MICPNCKHSLTAHNWDNRTHINKVSYTCSLCAKKFERHTIIDSSGLVKDDIFYEINDEGIIMREWL